MIFSWNILRRIFCLGLVLAAGGFPAVAVPESGQGPDRFYLWQRVRIPSVAAAVDQEPASIPMYYLSRELLSDRTVAVVSPFSERHNESFIPVFRVHAWPDLDKAFKDGRLKQTLLHELAVVQKEFAMAGRPLAEWQLDLDCPERLLNSYAAFLADLRPAIAPLRLSVTVLPCHLSCHGIAKLAGACDEIILQVHGVEIPKDPKQKPELLKRSVAEKAIRRAEELELPYRVALPCYGQRLLYTRGTGKCLGTASEEAGPEVDSLYESRFCQPDAADLLALRQQALASPHCRGLVWFRLPVKGDRFCWDRESVRMLQQGDLPMPGMTTRWAEKSLGLCELILENRGILGYRQAELKLDWKGSRNVEYGLYAGVAAESMPGVAPATMTCSVPSPGESLRVAWFRMPVSQQPLVESHLQP